MKKECFPSKHLRATAMWSGVFPWLSTELTVLRSFSPNDTKCSSSIDTDPLLTMRCTSPRIPIRREKKKKIWLRLRRHRVLRWKSPQSAPHVGPRLVFSRTSTTASTVGGCFATPVQARSMLCQSPLDTRRNSAFVETATSTSENFICPQTKMTPHSFPTRVSSRYYLFFLFFFIFSSSFFLFFFFSFFLIFLSPEKMGSENKK